MLLSLEPSTRNTRGGVGSHLLISVGYPPPPRNPTKVLTLLNTRLNASDRSQAAVKAQIAPLLEPPIARSFADFESLIARPSLVVFVSSAGSNSSSRKRA